MRVKKIKCKISKLLNYVTIQYYEQLKKNDLIKTKYFNEYFRHNIYIFFYFISTRYVDVFEIVEWGSSHEDGHIFGFAVYKQIYI